MNPHARGRRAQRAFGNVAGVKERFYETSRWIWLDQLWQDLRYAWRGLRHSPAFVATTVLTLAVGLGLLTIAFTIVNAYVLRPFAVRDPGGLHQIVWHSRDGGGDRVPLARPRGAEPPQRSVQRRHRRAHAVRVVERPAAMAAVVSLNYFEALGPAMRLGRGLGRIDADSIGNPAVITDQAWARLYDRDPAAVGRAIDLNGRPFTIVGVLGPAFTGLGDQPRDVFVPLTPSWDARRGLANETRETELIVRLQPGVTAAQAESALTPFLNRIIEKQADLRAEVRPQPSPNTLSIELLAVLAPVFAAFVLVLVTACANVSNVMLARAIARHREIAVRLSLGASRGRLVRQLLTEGLLIACLAGAAGLAIASWGLRAATIALFSTLPPSVAPLLRLVPLTFDYRVFLFALAASAARR